MPSNATATTVTTNAVTAVKAATSANNNNKTTNNNKSRIMPSQKNIPNSTLKFTPYTTMNAAPTSSSSTITSVQRITRSSSKTTTFKLHL